MTLDEYKKTMQLVNSTLNGINQQLAPIFEELRIYQNGLITPLNKMLDETVALYISRMQDIIQSSTGYREIYNSFSELGENIASEVDKLLSERNYSDIGKSILDIQIDKDYVSMPKVLIPNDFSYEEIPANSVDSNRYLKSSRFRKLSLADALAIINIIITVLLWCLSQFMSQTNTVISPSPTESRVPMTEAQAQQVIEYLSELTIQQQTVIDLLEDSAKHNQEHFSDSADIPQSIESTDSMQSLVSELNSTSDYESDSPESTTVPEQP